MRTRFAQRSLKFERLDTGDYTAEEFDKWQREMSWINQTLGEVRALRNSLLSEIRANDKREISALEVGAGSGLLMRKLHRWLGGRRSFLVGTEIDTASVRSIHRASPSSEVEALQCDGLYLPFADGSFDYVFCSLLLHHLNDEDAVKMLREMKRVARKRIFVIDLNRSPFAYYFYKAVSRIFFQRFTREDGALSILRSFKPAEMRKLAETAGLREIKIMSSAAYRLVLSGK